MFGDELEPRLRERGAERQGCPRKERCPRESKVRLLSLLRRDVGSGCVDVRVCSKRLRSERREGMFQYVEVGAP